MDIVKGAAVSTPSSVSEVNVLPSRPLVAKNEEKKCKILRKNIKRLMFRMTAEHNLWSQKKRGPKSKNRKDNRKFKRNSIKLTKNLWFIPFSLLSS